MAVCGGLSKTALNVVARTLILDRSCEEVLCLANLHKLSDALYRSAQPSEKGMKNLKAAGITTIVASGSSRLTAILGTSRERRST